MIILFFVAIPLVLVQLQMMKKAYGEPAAVMAVNDIIKVELDSMKGEKIAISLCCHVDLQ